MSNKMDEISFEEARKAMIAKRFGGNVNGASTGGEGSVRRKKKGFNRYGDDRRLGVVLKKMALIDIKGVEEVNIFKTDGTVIHISTPRIQASVPSNTYIVSGEAENKRLEELLPGIYSQLGPESMDYLRSYQEQVSSSRAAQGGAYGGTTGADFEDEDDDELPDLVETFEEAAETLKS